MSSAAAHGWNRVPLGPNVGVLQIHPCGLAALSKPAGVLSHPNGPDEQSRSLLNAAYDAASRRYDWTDEGGSTRSVWLLHRLDSATSGLILLAADEALAATIRGVWSNPRVIKTYHAIVFGHPREKAAVWRDRLAVKRSSSGVRARVGGELEAEAAMRRVRLIPGPPALAALELDLRTGRTHQLRFQCSRRGLPIVGDQNYGNFRLNRDFARRAGTDRLFLHASELSMEFSFRGNHVRFAASAPLPREFLALIPGV